MKKFVKNLASKLNARYPFTLVDIGAMCGVQNKWKILNPYLRVIGFEPDEREFKKLLQSKNETYFNCFLFSEPKTLTYYRTQIHGNSSVLRSNIKLLSQFQGQGHIDVEVEKEIEIPKEKVKTLAGALKENSIFDVDFIKIDTEGSELYILEGAAGFINKNFGMQVEVNFIQRYIDGPSFRDIDKFMLSNGYELIDIRRNYWKRIDRLKLGASGRYKGKGQIIFADALYLRNIEIFLSDLGIFSSDKSYILSKIYKSILVCIVYRLYDYAEGIINGALEKKFINQEDYNFISGELKRLTKKMRLPCFPLRSFMYRVCNKMAKILRNETDMIDLDLTIANVIDN